jgi:hypothetical protein
MDEHLAAIGVLQDHVPMADDDLEKARDNLKGISAKLFANELDPNVERAKARPRHGCHKLSWRGLKNLRYMRGDIMGPVCISRSSTKTTTSA